nr:NUDIX domain-containing protein [Candidatus Saccharibacteria bacterium]
TIIPAVWVMVKNTQNELYLLRRANTGWKDGWYIVPAGHIEAGQSPRQAAVRELQEEVGVYTTVDDLSEPMVYFYPADDMTHERVSLFFVLENYDGPIKNNEPHKADSAGWFRMSDLPKNLVPMLRKALEDSTKNQYYFDDLYDPTTHANLFTTTT